MRHLQPAKRGQEAVKLSKQSRMRATLAKRARRANLEKKLLVVFKLFFSAFVFENTNNNNLSPQRPNL